MKPIDQAAQQILDEHGLKPKEQFTTGHSGAFVILCESDTLSHVVLKVAVDSRSKEELEANIRGYESIRQEGLNRLLPDILIIPSRPGRELTFPFDD